MDPLFDEKIIVTMLRGLPEFILDHLHVHAEKEAYGPSKNEGLCYESCSALPFTGDVNGNIYLAMDGYTKLKLLPRIAERYQIDPNMKGMADSVLMEFGNQIVAAVLQELEDGGFNVQLGVPENLSHKLVPIDSKLFRQYIMIFFLRDRREKIYLGRIYLVLTIQKF